MKLSRRLERVRNALIYIGRGIVEKDLFQRVIEVEREIQHRLAHEKKKANDRLEEVRRACAKQIEDEKERLERNFGRALDEAREKARQEADQLLSEKSKFAAVLENISPEIFRKSVLKHLARILPGAADDP